MRVKKQFEEIFEVLEANKNKKVSTILPQLLELMQAKTAANSTYKQIGGVTYIFCYYHKQWEVVEGELNDGVPYGAKKSTAHGYNTMCKEGTSAWTKANRTYKKAKKLLLDDVANGTIAAEEVGAKMVELEELRADIVPLSDALMQYVLDEEPK